MQDGKTLNLLDLADQKPRSGRFIGGGVRRAALALRTKLAALPPVVEPRPSRQRRRYIERKADKAAFRAARRSAVIARRANKPRVRVL